jgi:hypothetical protein
MEITMNVKVKAPETQLDGIPDFLKRAPSTDPAAPTAEVAANAIIEQSGGLSGLALCGGPGEGGDTAM